MHKIRWTVLITGLVLLWVTTACSIDFSTDSTAAQSPPDPEIEVVHIEVTPHIPTVSAGPTATLLPTPDNAGNIYVVVTSTPSFVEPAGCLKPPDDYTRVQIGNATINARTLWMLQRAQQLYGGTIPITSSGITQGSYNPGAVAASFGTHDGGGAVDLTVRNLPYDYSIKWDDIPRLIDALRLAGFAAFYRDEREDLVSHIHAIAIGDAELSPIAAAQLTGRFGYFRGYDGFPRVDGVPLTPRYGELIICQWMLDMGYYDMRGEPLPLE